MKPFLRIVCAGVLVLALPLAVRAACAAAIAQGAAGVSATDVAPFLGEWTLALEGPNGPGTFTLSITIEKEKVIGEIASDAIGKQPITSMSLADKTLALGYAFTWEGNPVEAVASLTPEKDGKTRAQMDFANGAYLMTGTATRAEKSEGK
jgi:hypothetical protein